MIVVTGGTGMLGSYLLLELTARHHRIVAFKRPNSNLNITQKVFNAFLSDADERLNRIEWVDVVLTDYAELCLKMQGVDEVYHCAAEILSPNNSYGIIERNTEISSNLAQAAIHNQVKKFCFVSSIAALGSANGEALITEETLWKEGQSNSPYSKSKYESELIIWRAIAEGLNAVIVNPSVILGVGDWHKGSPSLFKTIAKGLKYYTKGITGFVDASDVAKCMVDLMDNESSFGQSFIVSSENWTYQNAFNRIADHLKVKAPSLYASFFLSQLAWRMEWFKSRITGNAPVITKNSAKTAYKVLEYDNQKIKTLLNFSFKPIESSIADIAAIYVKSES